MTSSLHPHSTSFPMRPSDKDMGVFDLDDLFEQYVETDLLQLSDNTAEPSGSDDLAHLFESSNENDPIETLPMPDWEPSSHDAWHKALRALDQNLASPFASPNCCSVYPESRGKASFSDPELFQLDDHFDLERTEPRRTYSQPPTPQPQTARLDPNAYSTAERLNSQKIQKASKKTSRFTKMMRPSTYRTGLHDLWSRKTEAAAEAFGIQLRPNGLNPSPPPSAKIMPEDSTSDFFSRNQSYTVAMSRPAVNNTDARHTSYQLSPHSSPSIGISTSDSGNHNNYGFANNNMAANNMPSHFSNAALSALQTPPPSNSLPMTTWAPETPANLDFSFPASPNYQSLNSQAWWGTNTSLSNDTAPQPSGRPSYMRSQSDQVGFGNSSNNDNNNNNNNDNNNNNNSNTSLTGLGISCDTAPFSGFGASVEMGTSPSTSNAGFGNLSASSFDMPSFSQQPIYPHSDGIHIGNPPSRSPSPTATHSPTPQPRFQRRRHSSHHTHSSHLPNHHSQPQTAQRRASRAHSRKSSGGHSATSQKQCSVQKPGQVGFVNFTPHDSKKILTGVAPSGSSKTKARREKEAMERRRKLSQAAVKAVIEAGGDLSALEGLEGLEEVRGLLGVQV